MAENNKPIKKICFYGIGGVGGYFGGIMANKINQEKDSQSEIYFIARGKHLHAIKENGLIINMPGQNELLCKPTLAVEKISEIPTPDLIFICVKSYDLEQVINEISNYINEDTVIVPLLNGVDIYNRIRSVINKGLILPACVYVASYIEKPGYVKLNNKGGYMVLGKDPEHQDVLPQNILDLLKNSNIFYKWFDNACPAIWEKYLFVASFALVTARYGKTIKEITRDSKTKDVLVNIMNEIISIAKYEGINLSDNSVDNALQIAEGLPQETKTSFQRDIEQNKLNNEGNIFWGTIIELGKKHGIPTPVTQEICCKIIGELDSSQ